MKSADEVQDHSQMTPLERKLARNRSPLLSQEVMDRVAREHAAYFRELAAARDRQPPPDKQHTETQPPSWVFCVWSLGFGRSSLEVVDCRY